LRDLRLPNRIIASPTSSVWAAAENKRSKMIFRFRSASAAIS
jgi:hypothetical protein